jgi:hypothetical protein
MVIEVNNTFDERRIYFMERSAGDMAASKKAEQNFGRSWEKDFHVSPFNSRHRLYTLQAAYPYANAKKGECNLDCNIVMKSGDKKTKVVARVFSTGSALDAMSMTRWQTLAFVWRWWWVGLMMNPRILREARILWGKNLPIYYRPGVLKTSIGRKGSPEEAQLEKYFLLLLERLAQCSQNGRLLRYIPAAGPRRGAQRTLGISKSVPAYHCQPLRFKP